MNDLKDLAARHSIVIWLKSPIDGKGLDNPDGSPMTITAYTSDSIEFRAVLAELRKTAKNDSDPSALGDDLLARVIVSVDLTLNGKKVKPEAMKDLLTNPGYAWMREQLDSAVMDRTRFFGETSGS